jgi:hypothetical protein
LETDSDKPRGKNALRSHPSAAKPQGGGRSARSCGGRKQFASPDDELKAIFRAKAGEPITISVRDSIRVTLEVNQVSMEDFVTEVRKHVANDWRNPAGFLRDLSKRFRA